MNRFESLRPETGEAGAPSRLVRHMRSQLTSYDAGGVKVKQPRRVDSPNLSPTRAPSVPGDRKLWSHWSHNVPIERIGFVLLAEDGTPVAAGGGC